MFSSRPFLTFALFAFAGASQLLNIPRADACAYLGPTWAGQPTSGCCANFTSQLNNFDTTPDLNGAIDGYNNWNYSPANVEWQSQNPSVPTIQDVSNPGVMWDGNTVWNQDGNGNFTQADVFLNEVFTNSYAQWVIDGVAAHEIGHQMGLNHTNGCVLMTPSTGTRMSCGISTPQTDDINCVNGLY